MMNLVPRDPMQWGFMCAASFVRAISCFMRYAGTFCVAIGMTLIFLVGGLFMHAIIPIMAESTVQLVCHLIIAMVLLFNIYFNYALCCATDPGIITAKWKSAAEIYDAAVDDPSDDGEDEEGVELEQGDSDGSELETGRLPRIRPSAVTPDGKNGSSRVQLPRVQLIDPQSVARQRGVEEGISYCRRCRHFRPRRAHHCSVCNRCIAHLDHHCPWVNNCIGRDNYRYFFSFLLWLAVGCYYAAYMSYRAVYTDLSREQYARMLVLAQVRSFNISASNTLQLVFAISASAGLAVSILATWHVFLITTAQTSVELQINRHPRNRRLHGGKVVSPYSTGSVHGNWELVFGRCKYKVLSLMPSTRLPPNPRTLNKKKKRAISEDVESVNAGSSDAIV
ncbi:DHHC domain-containing protein [Phytophthora infestans]|uniref:Palmitoyltransferase n=1 Tax=Phytophthora infestans TaxID=4787 RepID=A0A833W5N3_PHYIN|nr:DHHC domain-containing protein [Phytophthora infestans]